MSQHQEAGERAASHRPAIVLPATIAAAVSLVGMEWLFQVTRLSLLSTVSWPGKVATLFTAPLPFVVAGCVAVVALWAGSRLPVGRRGRRALRVAAQSPAVLLWTALLMLLVDNFTRTLFGFGIQNSTGMARWGYAGILLVLVVGAMLLHRGVLRVLDRSGVAMRSALMLPVGIGVILLGVGWLRGDLGARDALEVLGGFPEPKRRPNILLISSDGVDADHMSIYDYERPTTPFLASLVDDGLLCENSYANCARTTGSVTSILTGRPTTDTGVLFPPDVLRGDDAFRHLPGILRQAGYRTWHMSIRHFADAFDLDFRDAFDTSTFQSLSPVALTGVLGETSGRFVARTVTRLRDRIGHVFGEPTTPAAFVEVKMAGDSGELPDTDLVLYADDTRIDALVDFIASSETPFFAHVHLMTTHGARFPVKHKVFSAGQRQHSTWMVDFYDDAILEFDTHLSRVFAALGSRDVLDNTLVIVHSDHGLAWDNLKRTPLLFLFPGGEHAGRIRNNVQNLDIAPTVVDYLGLPQPSWMPGLSLLHGEPPRMRPIYSTDSDEEAFVHRNLRAHIPPSTLEPPFYSMRKMTMIVCNRNYTVDLLRRDLAFGDVQGHTSPCAADSLPTPQQAFVRILAHLQESGFDVSSFGASP